MGDIEIKQLQEKVEKGLKLARKRLIEKTKRENGELIIEQNEKIVIVKAENL